MKYKVLSAEKESQSAKEEFKQNNYNEDYQFFSSHNLPKRNLNKSYWDWWEKMTGGHNLPKRNLNTAKKWIGLHF